MALFYRDIYHHIFMFESIPHLKGSKYRDTMKYEERQRITRIIGFIKALDSKTADIICKKYLRLFTVPYQGNNYYRVPKNINYDHFEEALANYRTAEFGVQNLEIEKKLEEIRPRSRELIKETIVKQETATKFVIPKDETSSLINEWQTALRHEVNYLKEQGGTQYSIINGKFLYRDSNTSVYLFTLVSEVFFPDGTPVRIERVNNSIFGEVLSVEGFEIELKLDSFIGEEIKDAKMYSEPWQLMVELSNRLEDIKGSETKRRRVESLIGGNAKTKHEEKLKEKKKELLYRSYFNQTTYIWGPPGTGKTYNLSRIVTSNYLKGRNILVMAHSNAAVDVLMAEVMNVLEEKEKWVEGDVLRYGYSRDETIMSHQSLLSSKLVELKHPKLKKERQELEQRRGILKKKAENRKATKQDEKEISELYKALKKLKADIKDLEKEYVRKSKIVGATLTKCAMDSILYTRMFDLVVVDEVSMAYVPQLAMAAALGKKIVVCGDFKQLPPIALAEHELVEKWLREDIFHHAGIVRALKGGGKHPNLYMLHKQRRMHPEISSFTNEFIYNRKVKDHKDAYKRQGIAENLPFPNKATMLIDLAKMGAFALKDSSSHSRFNIMSGLMSIHLALLAKKNNLDSIGIITPYKAQARFMTSCLKELQGKMSIGNTQYIVASTVHRFQGSERDVIIFDVVDSFPQKRPSVLLTDKNSSSLPLQT
ncbi:DEAD/DEAH box helicase [Neobacillus sp. SAB-20_R2A]|uniref:DEAD/DEAH box helicase n=1 Tax=Neobacillus sp. SAB-20_R2A TaxID=3120519 RepID=UPI003C6E962B